MALIDKLNAIGDAIRAKTGGTEKLTLDQMPTAISGIEGGGGGGSDIVDKSIVKYHDSTVTAIGAYVFYNCDSLTEVNVPSVTSVGAYAFSGCNSLKQFDGDKLQSIATYAFTECTALTSLTLPKVTSIAAYAFNGCGASYLSCQSLKTLSANNVFRGSKFVSVDFPILTTLSNNAFRNQGYIERVTFPLLTSTATEAMRNCGALTYADLPLCRSLGTYTFYDCVNLETLILRKSDAICTMSNINALQNTKIANGEGHIYVPKALLSDEDETKDYRRATNWSVATLVTQLRPIVATFADLASIDGSVYNRAFVDDENCVYIYDGSAWAKEA